MMLSLDFEEIAIIEIIATAKIMAAIVPNSGTTNVPITSISSAPAGNITVTSLHRDLLPSSWGYYKPTIVDVLTLIGSFGLFFTIELIALTNKCAPFSGTNRPTKTTSFFLSGM